MFFFNLPARTFCNKISIRIWDVEQGYDDTNDNHNDFDGCHLLELGGVHFEDMQSAGNRRPRGVLSWGSSMITMIFMLMI